MITVDWPCKQSRYPRAEFRRMFHPIRRPVPADGAMVTAYTDGVVTLRSNRRLDGYHEAADMAGMQGVLRGDFVVHGLDILRGSIGVSDSDGAMSSVCIVCAPNRVLEPRYFAWQLRAQAYSGLPRAMARGVREGGADFRRWDTLAEVPVLVPPVEEQRAIANYLDVETARIDALIEKKQRLIALLEDRHRVLVQQLTGVGTSSIQGGRPSESPAQSLLPRNWNLVRARFLCDVETGESDTDQGSETGQYPFFVRSQVPQRSDRYLFDCEAVLTAGDGAGVGKVFHHYNGKFDAHQRVYVLHGFRGISGRFFYYYFSSAFAAGALDGSAKSTVDSVRRHMITDLLIAVPPVVEQDQIVRDLDHAEQKRGSLRTLIQSQLDLLREHRQALITAAVTGDLEIPGAAA